MTDSDEFVDKTVPDSLRQLAGYWLPVLRAADLKQRPQSVQLLNIPLVVFRRSDGPASLLDRCSHRGVALSEGRIVSNCVQCPYHGWQFNGQGRCVKRPGPVDVMTNGNSVPAFDVTEYAGLVWVRLSNGGSAQPLQRPWSSNDDLQSFVWVDEIKCRLADGLENLLDATHTPFVHSGLVRSQTESKLFSAVVRVNKNMVEAEYVNEGKQEGMISKLFERDRAESFGRFLPPCLAELEYRSSRGVEFVLNSWFVPIDEQTQKVISVIYLRNSWIPLWIRKAIISPFFRRVLSQDCDILDLQRENIDRFGSQEYQLWEGDVMRGWIDKWLSTGDLSESSVEFELDFYL